MVAIPVAFARAASAIFLQSLSFLGSQSISSPPLAEADALPPDVPPEILTVEPPDPESDVLLADGSPVDSDVLPVLALADPDVLLPEFSSVDSCVPLLDSSVTGSDVSLSDESPVDSCVSLLDSPVTESDLSLSDEPDAEFVPSPEESDPRLLDGLLPDAPWVPKPASTNSPRAVLP
ncbi:MAG: hypothetical protein V1245_08810 [Arenicellales bacterium]|jgi:hypothetical protein|nr:hypothetical protein [Arenicellales bacterium]MEE1559496.1 hypothetical protein [Arenicellales bacterium]